MLDGQILALYLDILLIILICSIPICIKKDLPFGTTRICNLPLIQAVFSFILPPEGKLLLWDEVVFTCQGINVFCKRWASEFVLIFLSSQKSDTEIFGRLLRYLVCLSFKSFDWNNVSSLKDKGVKFLAKDIISKQFSRTHMFLTISIQYTWNFKLVLKYLSSKSI